MKKPDPASMRSQAINVLAHFETHAYPSHWHAEERRMLSAWVHRRMPLPWAELSRAVTRCQHTIDHFMSPGTGTLLGEDGCADLGSEL